MNPIDVKVSDELTLEAGRIEETAGQFVIHPAGTPMIDQLLAYLEHKPYHYSGIQTQHLAVGSLRCASVGAAISPPSWMRPPACIPLSLAFTKNSPGNTASSATRK